MLFAFTCLVLGKVRLVATWLTVKRGGHLSDKPLRQKRSAVTDVTASLINWVYVLQSNNILTVFETTSDSTIASTVMFLSTYACKTVFSL
ncbi:hypothetical protein EDB81DRAFT_806911, partial [Dactylonectria macrodidyma]